MVASQAQWQVCLCPSAHGCAGCSAKALSRQFGQGVERTCSQFQFAFSTREWIVWGTQSRLLPTRLPEYQCCACGLECIVVGKLLDDEKLRGFCAFHFSCGRCIFNRPGTTGKMNRVVVEKLWQHEAGDQGDPWCPSSSVFRTFSSRFGCSFLAWRAFVCIFGRDLRSDQNCFGLQSLQTCWHRITCRQESDVESRRRSDRANRDRCKGMEPSMCDRQLWQANVPDNKLRMAVVVSMLRVAELPLFVNSSTQLVKGLEAATWWCWMSWQRLFWRVFSENRSSRKLI